MKKSIAVTSLSIVLLLAGCGQSEAKTLETDALTENTDVRNELSSENTPFEKHGKLSVNGAELVDKNGEKYRLYGMSTHGLAWFPQYVNREAFATLLNDWNTNCVRLSMYTYENGGYCTDGDKEQLKELIKSGVSYADELGMYVIIDWHVLNDKDPNIYIEEAKSFF